MTLKGELVLGGKYCFITGVGKNNRLVGTGRQLTENERLLDRSAGVEQSALLLHSAAECTTCVIHLDPDERPVSRITVVPNFELDRASAVLRRRETALVLENHRRPCLVVQMRCDLNCVPHHRADGDLLHTALVWRVYCALD